MDAVEKKIDENPESSRDLISRLFTALGIERVVNVDDDHAAEGEESFEDVAAAIRSGNIETSIVVQVFPGEDGFEDADEDVNDVIERLSEVWRDLDKERRKELTRVALRDVSGDGESEKRDDDTSLVSLPMLLGETVEFKKMGFYEWREQGGGLLDDKKPTLLLFDRSFEDEGCSDTAGQDLAKAVLEREDLSHVYVGLLTHTAIDEESEASLTEEITQLASANGRQVIVIAKNRLGEKHTFPEALRMVLYADEIERFRNHAIESLREACCSSVRFLEGVERYALMATFEASRREGVYETENAIRMASAPGRKVLDRKLRDEEFVQSSLQRLREAASVDLYFQAGMKPERLNRFSWDEKFDGKEHLSELCLPVEVGDIYRFYDIFDEGAESSGEGYYVLLAQPCDVSVRGSGKRNNNLTSFVLTKLVQAKTDRESGNVLPEKPNQKNIGQFDLCSNLPWYVDFTKQVRVPAIALDACVFSGTGKSIVSMDDMPSNKLSASWKKRQQGVVKEARGVVDKYKRLSGAILENKADKANFLKARRELAAAIAGGCSDVKKGLTAEVDADQGVVRYGIERYARVTERTAQGLLLLMANHHARPAFDNEVFAGS